MAVLNLVLYPDEPLLDVADPIDTVGPAELHLAEDMLETMHAYDGVGLAGPQVGISRQILVLQEPEGPPMCLINPDIYEVEGEDTGEEGCLSLPEVYAPVKRASRIRVRALNEHGHQLDLEATDLLARIIQHETDHLHGKLFVDHLDILTRQDKLEEWGGIRDRLLSAPRHG